MTRLAGVSIPDNKQIQVSLTYIYGIGPANSRRLLTQAGVNPETRTRQLSDADISRLQEIINKSFTVEGNLQRLVSGNIKRLKDIQSYRGLRHKAGLPVRGQRTRTNARTKRGRRLAVGGAQPKAASKT